MSEVGAVRRGGVLAASFKLMRPKQWVKNGLLVAGVLFSGRFTEPADLARVTVAIAVFSLLSSSGYILNDYLDREADRNHPKKRFRPIAAREVSEGWAIGQMALLLVVGVAVGGWLSPAFLLVALAYLATTVSYSLYFKHRVILDVMFLGACYLWRAVAGAVVIAAPVSPWLLLCTAFLSLFLGFGKRRAELEQLGHGAATRKNLAEYSAKMLEQFQGLVTSSTVISYALYTVLGPTPWMTLTLPYVLYGMFRYIYLVEQKGEGGAPDETFLKDAPLLVTVGLYGLTAAAVLLGEQLGYIPGNTP
jgi:4-hydroxybenzoate polyprenyltransferase